MYFVLDYSCFKFYACATTEAVEKAIAGLERNNVPAQLIEIILANNPDIRLNVEEYLSYNW